MSEETKSNLYEIKPPPPNAQARESMIGALSQALADVGSGETRGLVLIKVTANGYNLSWHGVVEPVPLAGIMETAKLQVLNALLAQMTRPGPKP